MGVGHSEISTLYGEVLMPITAKVTRRHVKFYVNIYYNSNHGREDALC
jgi:hypothetical protein